MADVAFNSSDHKLTASDVPQGEEALQKSSQAVGGLASGQAAHWTPEPAAQLLGKAIADFFSACGKAFLQEKKTLDEFGTNVDLAIAEFARVNESTGDELKKIQDSITNPEIREKLGKGLPPPLRRPMKAVPPSRLTGPTRWQPLHPLARMPRIRVRPTSANPRPAAPRSPASNIPLRFQEQGEVSWLPARNTSS